MVVTTLAMHMAMIQFFFRSFTYRYDCACEVQALIGQRMIEVHCYHFIVEAHNPTMQGISHLILHRDDIANLKDTFGHIRTLENTRRDTNYCLSVRYSVTFFCGKQKFKAVASLQTFQVAVERFQRLAYSVNKYEGILIRRGISHFTVGKGKRIGKAHHAVLFNVHFGFCCNTAKVSFFKTSTCDR